MNYTESNNITEQQERMKKTFFIIITIWAGLNLFACKMNYDSGILPDNNPHESGREVEENTVNDDAVNRDVKDDSSRNRFIENVDINDAADGNVLTQKGDESYENEDENENGSIITDKSDTTVYYIAGNGVRMREDASLESGIIMMLNKGTKVEYMDKKGEWIKVRYNNETGYIRSDLLSKTQPNENTTQRTLEAEDSSAEAAALENPKIIVKKDDRILQLWDDDSLRASYPIGLGWEPVGDKKKEGDGKTPEGIYYVCTRNNYSRFYLSLGLSYPNIEDAKEALDEGLIDQGTYNQIEDAINRGVQPPWNTALGGEIMIHGHGSQSDWTAGCIAVDNDVMDILWENCGLGTTVIIEP
jgi:hypothetical protein